MIEISFRIGLFVAVLGGVLALLATFPSELPQQALDTIATFIAAVNNWSYFLPISTFAQVLVAALFFWGVMAIWDISSWLMVRITR